ncbi:uncharacterized protein Y057_7597 [Fusarium fujikuroi]|nr:uncharacterized protein Y057_7597 [Fusarium fujikuroi]
MGDTLACRPTVVYSSRSQCPTHGILLIETMPCDGEFINLNLFFTPQRIQAAKCEMLHTDSLARQSENQGGADPGSRPVRLYRTIVFSLRRLDTPIERVIIHQQFSTAVATSTGCHGLTIVFDMTRTVSLR